MKPPKKSRVSEMVEVLKQNDIAHGLNPQKLRQIMEDLGPTFVKLGQILSMRADLIPSNYCEELTKLRSQVTPMPFSQVKQVIRQEYGVKSIHQVFLSFESEPLGSASIAQVHRAVLRNGDPVVVKVQRPGIKEQMGQDVAILRRVISLVKFAPELGDPLDFQVMLEEMWVTAQQEMDFLIEASHLEEFAKLNREIQYISCPKVEKHLTTSRILVMEYVEGIPIDHKNELLELGYNLNEIAMKLAENYTKQVLDDGFFHADPHPGNIAIRDGKIIWLDLGMVGKISQRDRSLFTTAMQAIIDGDVYELKNVVLSIGVLRQKINHAALYNDIDLIMTKYATADFASINLGRFIMELNDLTNRHHIGMPEGVSMLGRGLMTIEGVLADINPDINFMQIVTVHLAGQELDIQKELKQTSITALNTLRKTLDIPAHLADILKMTVKGQTKINLEITGSEEPLSKIDAMVNKIILAIICAGLLIGSSLVCTTDMSGKLFGIPALGAIGFFLAVILGGIIVYDILRKKK
ncbi:MAG: ABC1 kinase family protein [Candidatus Merdivicinus sp.]|jgi:ubiquinone biosynthesis protein